MDGIISLNKPVGVTSAKALYRIRSLTKERKSGHAGTLDPAACGVLILCLGKATKLVELLMDQPKVYRAVARLDVTSESFDSDRPLKHVEVREIPPTDKVGAALSGFVGEIEQVPPAISAVKIDGVPAYKCARPDALSRLSPRSVRIYWLRMSSCVWPVVEFEMCCGRGTYVRSLVRDLGLRIGTGGCLTSLERRRVGPFAVEDAWTLEQISEASGTTDYLIPLDRARMLLDARDPEPCN